MSSVILRTVKHRLTDLVQKPGGVTFEAAVAGSEAELAAKAAPALEMLAGKVTDLEQLVEKGGLDAAGVEQAYSLASEIVNVSGSLNMKPLFATAYSLCEILDHFRTGGFSREAYDVHVRALRLIVSGRNPPNLERMIKGLDAVKARVLGGKLAE